MSTHATAPKRAKKCENCAAEYMPASGRQRWCDDCRTAPPPEFRARFGLYALTSASPGYEPADFAIPVGNNTQPVILALIGAVLGGDGVGSKKPAPTEAREHAKYLVELQERWWAGAFPAGCPVSKYLCAVRALAAYPEEYATFIGQRPAADRSAF